MYSLNHVIVERLAMITSTFVFPLDATVHFMWELELLPPVCLPYMCINWQLWNKGSCKHELMNTIAACWKFHEETKASFWKTSAPPVSCTTRSVVGTYGVALIVTYMGSEGPWILSPSILAQAVYMCSSRTVFYSTDIKARKCLIPRLG